MQYNKIIFVSEENTFTSPVAEAIMSKKLRDTAVEVESCGTIVLFPEPANPKGIAIAKSRGLDLDNHKARPITEDMFGEDVLILVMTEKIKSLVYDTYKNAVNVYTIKEYVGTSGDVETPYGKTIKEYGECYNNIEALISEVYDKLYVN